MSDGPDERARDRARLRKPESRAEMAQALRHLVRMYEPHAAPGDTVLLPAFAQLLSEKELHAPMDTFEQKEKALPLGDFERVVAEVARPESPSRRACGERLSGADRFR
jgi:hypothetical protein